MPVTPLLVDGAVLALVLGVALLGRRTTRPCRAAAAVAMVASLAAPPLAAAVRAPAWMMFVSVAMMAVAFYGVASVMSPQAAELPAGSLSDEAWAQFERDFREYVARQERARLGPDERSEHGNRPHHRGSSGHRSGRRHH